MNASSSGRYISPRFRGHHGLGKALVPRTSIPFLRATLRDRVRPARARGGKSKDKGEGQGEDSQHRAREPLGPGRPHGRFYRHPSSRVSILHLNSITLRSLITSTYYTCLLRPHMPRRLQPHATVYLQCTLAIVRGGIQPSASGIGIGQLERIPVQDPDHVGDDVCALERWVQHHPPNLHAQVLRRRVQQSNYARQRIAARLVGDCEDGLCGFSVYTQRLPIEERERVPAAHGGTCGGLRCVLGWVCGGVERRWSLRFGNFLVD